MDPATISLAISVAKALFGSVIKQGQIKLPPTHVYVRSYRCTGKGPDNDSNIIIEKATGIPTHRWSYKQQKVVPLSGITKQGIPVFTHDPFYWKLGDTIYREFYTDTIDPLFPVAPPLGNVPFPNTKGGTRRLWTDLTWFGPLNDPVEKNPYRGPTVEEAEQRITIGYTTAGIVAGGLVGALFGVNPITIISGLVIGAAAGNKVATHKNNLIATSGLRPEPAEEEKQALLNPGSRPEGGGRA